MCFDSCDAAVNFRKNLLLYVGLNYYLMFLSGPLQEKKRETY